MVVVRGCERAGLPRVHAHRLRHSAATEMLRAGGSLAEIGQVLRHSRPVTTSIYAKAEPGAQPVCQRRPVRLSFGLELGQRRTVALDRGPHRDHLVRRQHQETGPAALGVGQHRRLMQRLPVGQWQFCSRSAAGGSPPTRAPSPTDPEHLREPSRPPSHLPVAN
ncbi:MAG: tyrosine-type recombinase/integrase [Micromonosporaceae bacterium]